MGLLVLSLAAQAQQPLRLVPQRHPTPYLDHHYVALAPLDDHDTHTTTMQPSYSLNVPLTDPMDAAAIHSALQTANAHENEQLINVNLQARRVMQRHGAFFDNLPWKWADSSLAKRDAAKGVDRRRGFRTHYEWMLSLVQVDCNAQVMSIIIENTDLFGPIVLGGALLLRPCPGSVPASQPYWCDCTPDEAIGLSIVTGLPVEVDISLWERTARAPSEIQVDRLNFLVGKLGNIDDGLIDELRPPAPLPWQISSLNELNELSTLDKARCALAAGLELPRARYVSDLVLIALLEPVLDETVRQELRIERAVSNQDYELAGRLKARKSKRSLLIEKMRAAVEDGRYREASELALMLRAETQRRQDISQDEGAYDEMLDQDDWYAQQLARERQREMEIERRRLGEGDNSTFRGGRTLMIASSERSGDNVFRFAGEERKISAVWDPVIEARVRESVVLAFDNIPSEEAESLLMECVSNAANGDEVAEQSLSELVRLTEEVENLHRQASLGPFGMNVEDALVFDEYRVLFSQVRLVLKKN